MDDKRNEGDSRLAAGPILRLENVHQRYGSSHILRGLSIAIPSRKLTVILGANGVGKTTLMKAIVGVVPITEGSIVFREQSIERLPAYQRVRLGIGYVPQGREIFPRLTVAENLLIGTQNAGLARQDIDKVYTLFPVLSQMAQRRGGDLSGGQQQQLAIGRALMGRPELLILDEPTEGIQPNVIQMIGETLRHLVERESLTVLLVEQYLEFAKALADTFFVLRKGQVVSQGDRHALQSASLAADMLAGH